MGRSTAISFDALDQPLTLVAVSAVAAGDLVKAEASGMVRKVSDALTIAMQNSVAGPAALIEINPKAGQAGGNSGAYGNHARNILPLPGGGYGVVYSGNGANALTGLQYSTYSDASVRQTDTVITANANQFISRLTRAGADNVMVVWSETTSLYGIVLNKTTGAVVLAQFTIGTVGNAVGHDWNLATLANGDVVVAYGGGAQAAFKRYNASGVLQGAEVVVEAASSPVSFVVLPLAAGGFIVRYSRTAATAGVRMARFNAGGVLQGALVAVTTGAALYEGGTAGIQATVGSLEGKIIELANGNIVTNSPAVLTEISFKVYDSSLALLSTVVALTGATSGLCESAQLAARAGGGFWMTLPYSPSNLQQYDNTGLLQRQGASNSGGAAHRVIDRPGTGPIVLIIANNPGAASSTTVRSFAGDLAQEGGSLVLTNNTSSGIGQLWMELLESGVLIQGFTGSSTSMYFRLSSVSPGAASVIGVASTAAAAGAPVRVATAGKFAINQSFPSVSFDRRASAPVGAKGVLYGSVVVLQGINS